MEFFHGVKMEPTSLPYVVKSQQPENNSLSPTDHSRDTSNSTGLLNTSFQYGNVLSDPSSIGGIPYNHASFIASVWPGSSICCDILPNYKNESSLPWVYTYYRIDGSPIGCGSAQISTPSIMPASSGNVTDFNSSAPPSNPAVATVSDTTSDVSGTLTTLSNFFYPLNTLLDPSGMLSSSNSMPGTHAAGSNSMPGFYAAGSNGIPGFHATDGCWYPGCPVSGGYTQVTKRDSEYQYCSPWIIPSHQGSEGVVNLDQDNVKVEENKKACIVSDDAHSSKPVALPHPYNCYGQLDKCMEMLGRPRLVPSVKNNRLQCVEDLFQYYMGLLFKNLPDLWVLSMAAPHHTFSQQWVVFKDMCKVRFYCETCSDGWTSMNGLIVFYFRLHHSERQGKICYKICGQKCLGCKSNKFELPLWYPEEAQKVVTNLYYKIASFYNLITPMINKSRRSGSPQTPHNSELCQGCVDGMCKLKSSW